MDSPAPPGDRRIREMSEITGLPTNPGGLEERDKTLTFNIHIIISHLIYSQICPGPLLRLLTGVDEMIQCLTQHLSSRGFLAMKGLP